MNGHENSLSILKTMLQRMDDCVFMQMEGDDPSSHPSIYLIYNQTLCKDKQMMKMITSDHLRWLRQFPEYVDVPLSSSPSLEFASDISRKHDYPDLAQKILTGYALLYYEATDIFYSIPIGNVPNRQPEESNMEASVRGSRDGFVEDLNINIALIRKRIHSTLLKCEYYEFGEMTKTKTALMYMDGVIQDHVLTEIRNQLNVVNIPSLVSINQLEAALHTNRFFPLFQYSGRPDFATKSLLDGKFLLLVDGNPSSSIAPNTFLLLLKSPEDIYFTTHNFGILSNSLRVIGLLVALFVPGLWASLVGFHQEQIPFPLLATVTVARTGLPVSSIMELFIILGLFELFREASLRLPRVVGQTLTVVGGIIIGESAIRAGLISPTLLVIAAITAVATFTLSNQELLATISLLRIFILILSSLFGFFGFFVGLYLILSYFADLKSFGIYLTTPLSKLSLKGK
jgi:spore germination protein KA